MYGIVNNQPEVVKFLLPLEAHLGTEMPYTIPSFAYGEDYYMYLAKGSDIEKLAIICGDDTVYQLVFDYYKKYNLQVLFREEEDAKL